MIEMRRMQAGDIHEVLEIDRSSFTLPWTERSFKYEIEENKAARCWVTTVDGHVAAMMVLWMIIDEAHIATIATRPHYRRRGFASRMLTRALVLAREEGAKRALLEVRSRHVAAQNIYKSIGFVEVGRRSKYYHDNSEDAVLMTLDNLEKLECVEVG